MLRLMDYKRKSTSSVSSVASNDAIIAKRSDTYISSKHEIGDLDNFVLQAIAVSLDYR